MKRQVIAAVDDLFFAAKIRGTAEQAGAEVAFARDAGKLLEAARRGGAVALILDLQSNSIDPFAVAEQLKSDERTRDLPIVAFYSHVETELQKRARQAGIEHVLPRSVFNQRLAAILRGEF